MMKNRQHKRMLAAALLALLFACAPAWAAQTKLTTGITLSKTEMVRYTGKRFKITGRITAQGKRDKLIVSVSDPGVVRRVSSTNFRAVAPGRATVTFTSGSHSASCEVTVYDAPKGVTLDRQTLPLIRGESASLAATVAPATANPAVTWVSSAPAVARVDAAGRVTAVGAGVAVVKALTANGKAARCRVTVTAGDAGETTAYRALCVGTGLGQNGKVEDLSLFPIDARNFADMLANLSFGGKKVDVTTLSNPKRQEVLAALKSVFAGASDGDMNYLYLMCHGSKPTSAGYKIAIGRDATISAKELRKKLDQIPGTWVVILSSCYSGDVIGKATFAGGFVEEFLEAGVQRKSGELKGSRYKVLCGSTSAQEGWVFGYGTHAAWSLSGGALAKGAGWDYINRTTPVSTRLNADANSDSRVTLSEAYAYAAPLVRDMHDAYKIQSDAGVTQMVVYPQGDSTVIFARD